MKEVYDQILADLTTAESIMADDYARQGITDAAAAATKPAIQALLSRVYLYMGDWQNSADYATKVINNGKYKLAEGDKYKEMFTANVAPEGGEIIFEVYGSNKNEYWDGSGWEGISYITTGAEGSGDVSATKDLVDLYEDGDVRGEMFTMNENDYFTTKYAGKTGSGIPKENNIIVLRLSEMYLNRAGSTLQRRTRCQALRHNPIWKLLQPNAAPRLHLLLQLPFSRKDAKSWHSRDILPTTTHVPKPR